MPSLTPSNCPRCGVQTTGCTQVKRTGRRVDLYSKTLPGPGDGVICIECGGLAVFADDGYTLRLPNFEEIERYSSDVYSEVKLIQWSVKVRRRHQGG